MLPNTLQYTRQPPPFPTKNRLAQSVKHVKVEEACSRKLLNLSRLNFFIYKVEITISTFVQLENNVNKVIH